jgi:hypothetical protein
MIAITEPSWIAAASWPDLKSAMHKIRRDPSNRAILTRDGDPPWHNSLPRRRFRSPPAASDNYYSGKEKTDQRAMIGAGR